MSVRRPTLALLLLLGASAAAADDAYRTITFTEAVCGRIPPVPVTFQMPADFVGRAAGSTEAGCLWGTGEDLDRVMADPAQGDFTGLRRGVFRARLSTNVVASDQGMFDPLDGSGEAGLRRGIEQAGARVVTWQKTTLADLPALQIVADLGGSRVYMLYLGNTRYISNAMLVNFYPPARRSADDDALWARFVAAIKK